MTDHVAPTNNPQEPQPQPTPSVTITPASPENDPSATFTGTSDATMTKEKNPTDSETALLAKGAAKDNDAAAAGSSTAPATGASPIETLTRRLSRRSSNGAKVTEAEKAKGPTAVKQPAASTSAPSSSKPAAAKPAAASSAVPARKRKKKGGFKGLLAALGCLSAADLEDDDDKKKRDAGAAGTKKDMAQKTGAGVTKPATAAAPAAAATSAAVAPAGPSTKHPIENTDTTATTGTTLVGDGDKEPKDAGEGSRAKEAVVVPSPEPTTLPLEETAGVTSSAVQPPGSGSDLLSTPHRPSASRRGSDGGSPSRAAVTNTSSGDIDRTDTSGGFSDISETDVRGGDEVLAAGVDEGDYGLEDEYEDEEDKLIAQGGLGIPLDENGLPAPLLPAMDKVHHGRKCLVLDLDETLLHSSFKMLPSADYIVPVEIEGQTHNVYVIKRPGVDHFLTEMGKIYEVVVFTASLSKYADPVLDMLDPNGVVRHRLFRESCYNHKGNYVKDLSQLGRDIEISIIIDNSPASYIFHPNNAVPVSTWFNDPHDTELTDLCPFLTDLATVDDVRGVLDGSI